ncbi:hypothetical protein Csa_015146 [Cucumis sativus]|nr:hypothetical protein Csa_015146 [Cucumis sativus]
MAFVGEARHGPTLHSREWPLAKRVVVEDDVLEEESCDEIGEEYCLMRKTLAAHVDYIYTDTQKP